jgi:glucose/arabinose dehydrogenase
VAIVVFLWTAAPAAAGIDPVDPAFDDSALITGLERPTAVRFAPEPDGRLFVAEKGGTVKAFDGPLDPTPTPVIDLSDEVNDFWDRGLLGMALDPQFAELGGAKRRIWLLYARDGDAAHPPPRWNDHCPDPPDGPGATDSGCVITARLVYVTLDALGVAGDPVPVLENEWCAQFPSHTIGTVAFGPDGMLYVGAGDGASFSTVDEGQFGGQGGVPMNPCNDAAGEGGALRAQDARTPADGQTLSGTIIRVDPLTGAAAPGNPHAGAADANRRRVIAYGMRNPFRFAFRPGTPELWVGDVGWYRHEEINRVDTGDADAENLGWPCSEGHEATEYKSLGICASLGTGDVTPPVFSYDHGDEAAPADGCRADSGSSISGIAFNTADAFPSAYDGAMFFTDFARGCIWSMRAGAGGRPDPATAAVFARDAGDWSGAVDLQMGPNGDLVYAYMGADGGAIRRIRHRAPRAVITADPTSGRSPLSVHFSAAGSVDPAGGTLTYAWDLDGDGAFDDGTGAEVHWLYTEPGTVTARLQVTGAGGRTGEVATTVSVANDAPSDVRIVPREPVRPWAVGDRFELDGSAVDDDPAGMTLIWTLTIRHCKTGGGCHSHEIEQQTGPHASFTAPDHDYPAHLLVRLVARDRHGLTGEQTLRLDPATVTLRAEANPRSLVVGVNGAVGPSPRAQTLLAGSRAVLSVVTPQVVGGRTYRFAGWSDGSHEVRHTVAVLRDTTFVARFAGPPATGSPPVGKDPRDTARPRLRLLSRRLRLGRGRLDVRVVCPDEPCGLTARVRGARKTRVDLAAGRSAVVRLRLPARVRRALRERHRVRVRLELTAADAAGNLTRLRRVVRLTSAPTRKR